MVLGFYFFEGLNLIFFLVDEIVDKFTQEQANQYFLTLGKKVKTFFKYSDMRCMLIQLKDLELLLHHS